MDSDIEILNLLIPELGPWPAAYNDVDAIGPYIQDHLVRPLPPTGFRQSFREGGPSQGYYASYSVVSYWKTGRHQYPAGSFSHIAAAFLYVSHTAPIACIGFGPGLWQKQSGCKHAAAHTAPKIGERISLNGNVEEGWGDLYQHVAALLAPAGISQISLDQANSVLPKQAEHYEYFEGLELPRPVMLKDILFHAGIDRTY